MSALLKLKTILSMGTVFVLAIVAASLGGILVSRNIAYTSLFPHKSKPGIVKEFNTRLKLSSADATD